MLLCDCPKARMIREHVRLPLFATSNTQIGRAPQMQDSHNRHAQSPIRENCVQLKQQRQ